MISSKQIRAARALLDISQSDLARKVNLSLTALNNIERDNTTPRASTINEIENYLESQGIEFIEGDGVRLVENVFNVAVYEGNNAHSDFLKDIIKTLKKMDQEKRSIWWLGDNNRDCFRKNGLLQNYYEEMLKIKALERILVPFGYNNFYAPAETTQFKIYGTEKTYGTHFITGYGYKYCIGNDQKIVSIESKFITESLLCQFDEGWKIIAKETETEPRIFSALS
jgi:transcriptional regulator with XRE-family HTH domain